MTIKQVFNNEEMSVPVKVWTNDIDYNSQEQLRKIATLPFLHKHIAVMPDVHLGKGATVGSVIATKSAIIPASVGVDIGCGMAAYRLSLTGNDLPTNLKKVRGGIEDGIPLGAGGAHKYEQINGSNSLSTRLSLILGKHPDINKGAKNPAQFAYQIGSLGSGNHFIELCLDEEDRVWVMLHSGSRGIGNRIGQYFINKAKEEMLRWNIHLPDKDLAYLPEGSQYFDDYVEALLWAQDYARENRDRMLNIVLKSLANTLPPFMVTNEAINCHHNYVDIEHHYGENVWVTRKGAIRARKTDLGIIPGSMGAKSFIVRGKGNTESFCSCSHGAGRKFSRSEAKRRFNRADLKQQTMGIECRKDSEVIDEIPAAYKNIDDVMNNQSDLIEIIHTLRQVVNVKG